MCAKHPNYKQKFKPVADCLDCWKEWATKLSVENKELKRDNDILEKKINRFRSALLSESLIRDLS
jgi:hypothetical protein